MNKISLNYAFNLSYNILVVILPLVTTPYISRTIGAEGVGIYSYCLSISTYFIIAGTLGIPVYAKREIAFIQHEKEKISSLFSQLFSLQVVILFFALLIYLIVVWIMQVYFIMFLICGIGMLAALFDVSWLYIGIENFGKVVGRNFVVKILSVIAIFMLVKNKEDIYICFMYNDIKSGRQYMDVILCTSFYSIQCTII